MHRKNSLIIWAIFGLMSGFSSLAEEIPNSGPRSKIEANVLLTEADEASQKGNYDQAIRSLERFRNRYPSDPRILSVTMQLLEAYTVTRQFKKVVTLAKEAFHLKLLPETQIRIKNYLAMAYLDLKRYGDARAIADEIFKKAKSGKERETAMMIKLETLITQNSLKEAEALHDALETEAAKSEENKTAALDLKLDRFLAVQESRIKVLQCANTKQPAKTPKFSDQKFSEDDWLAYFNQKTNCMADIAPRLAELKKEKIDDANRAWCMSMQALTKEAKASKLEKFAKEKTLAKISQTGQMLKCNEQQPK